MSSSETQSIDMHTTSRSSSVVPWWTVLTAVGLTAAAVILVRRMTAATEPASLEDAVDQCDRAASMLEDRLGTNGSVLLAG